MFDLAALIPSPPVLVPELCGGLPGADDTHLAAGVPPLRAAVLAAARRLAGAARQWMILGVSAERDQTGPASSADAVDGAFAGAFDAAFDADAAGTFRGYGADLRVALSDAALTGDVPADPGLPLPVLIGGWVRGRAAESTVATARLVAPDAPAARCADLGRMLRSELDASPEPRGVLVVADGAATLSTGAPGYLDPRAQGVQDRIDDALCAGDRATLRTLDAPLCADLGVSGRAAYQVLAGLFQDDVPEVETLYRAAPFGVGYHVGLWRPGAGS